MRSAIASVCRPFTRTWQKLRPGLRVLMYHRVADLPEFDQLTVSPRRFEQQMRQLATSSRVVSLADGLRALREGGPREPLVAVTFDDGYLDNLVEAAPVLLRHAIPATVFVTTRFCDQSASHPRFARSGATSRLHLNWEEVAELAAAGIEIGSHTLSHPYLPTLPLDQARREIAHSRADIERNLGRVVRYFCYPSGDLGPRELRLVAEAGYEAAVSVAPGLNRGDFDPMQLRRTEITDRDDARAFALKLDGAFDPLHAVLHARRRRRFARAHQAPMPNP